MQGQTGGEITGQFAGANERGFQQRNEQCAEHIARANGPGRHAVDAGVKVIQPDVHALFKAVHGNLAGDGQQIVVQNHHVITVPTHPAADVQQNLRQEFQHAGNLVGDAFGGMVVPGVQRQQFFPADGVSEVKLMRAGHVAFAADTEQLGLHGVQIKLRRNGFLEDRIQRFREAGARSHAVGGRVLVTVRNPNIGHAGLAQRLAKGRADFAAADAVLNPELADGLVRARQRETVRRLGMGEIGGIEIQTEAVLFGPGDPVLEMFGSDFIAIHLLAAELAVEGVQVQPVFARHERQRQVQISAQFFRRAGLAGIVAGHGQTVAQRTAGVFETAHVVALPAVQRNGNRRESFQRMVHVHTQRGITLPGQDKSLFNIVVSHWNQ